MTVECNENAGSARSQANEFIADAAHERFPLFLAFSPYASIMFKATLPRGPQMRRKRRNESALESSQVET